MSAELEELLDVPASRNGYRDSLLDDRPAAQSLLLVHRRAASVTVRAPGGPDPTIAPIADLLDLTASRRGYRDALFAQSYPMCCCCSCSCGMRTR